MYTWILSLLIPFSPLFLFFLLPVSRISHSEPVQLTLIPLFIPHYTVFNTYHDHPSSSSSPIPPPPTPFSRKFDCLTLLMYPVWKVHKRKQCRKLNVYCRMIIVLSQTIVAGVCDVNVVMLASPWSDEKDLACDGLAVAWLSCPTLK